MLHRGGDLDRPTVLIGAKSKASRVVDPSTDHHHRLKSHNTVITRMLMLLAASVSTRSRTLTPAL